MSLDLKSTYDMFFKGNEPIYVKRSEKKEAEIFINEYVQRVLDDVRTIIRNNAPEDSVIKLVKEINILEDEIIKLNKKHLHLKPPLPPL
tara:strand:+ start:560 stop:826 length:267 start_codon:yes stop_codon:yes gene_type:complete